MRRGRYLLLLLVTLVFLETAGLVAITGRNATPLGAVRQLHGHVLLLARNAAWQIGGYAVVAGTCSCRASGC